MSKTQTLYPAEVRERSVSMVFDTLGSDESLKAATAFFGAEIDRQSQR